MNRSSISAYISALLLLQFLAVNTFILSPPLHSHAPLRSSSIQRSSPLHALKGGINVEPMENAYGSLVNDCATFFVDSFWSDKAETGSLTTGQRSTLLRRQEAEFRNRYGTSRNGKLVVARMKNLGDIVGVAGVEIADVTAGKNPMSSVPIMSNLAVGKQTRRRGVGGKLISGVENIVRGWDSDWLYLYVESTNRKAIKLYRKKGYRECGLDKDAKSLVPLENGGLTSKQVVCKVMRKRINGSFFQKLFNT